MDLQTHGLLSRTPRSQGSCGKIQDSPLMTLLCSGTISLAKKSRLTRHRSVSFGRDPQKWVTIINDSKSIPNYGERPVFPGLMEFLRINLVIVGSLLLPLRCLRCPRESTGSSGTKSTTKKEHSDSTSGLIMVGMLSTSMIDSQHRNVVTTYLDHGPLSPRLKVPGGCPYLRKLMPSLTKTMIEL